MALLISGATTFSIVGYIYISFIQFRIVSMNISHEIVGYCTRVLLNSCLLVFNLIESKIPTVFITVSFQYHLVALLIFGVAIFLIVDYHNMGLLNSYLLVLKLIE